MNWILFFHLIGFAFGFGAVMLVDIVGILWVLRRVKAKQVIWLSGITQYVIWLALFVQIITGINLLEFDEISLRTKIKLLAVVILGINGLVLDRIRTRLIAFDQADFWKLPRAFQAASIAAISLSQLGWWTATIIGFMTASS